MAKITHEQLLKATIKPEDRELDQKRQEYVRLESELADRELRLASIRAELSRFECQYLRDVGQRYAELDELKAQLAEHIATEQPGNDRALEIAREARARADETQRSAKTHETRDAKPFTPSQELKQLYRETARRVHPDLTSDRMDRIKRQELMAEANEAYEMGDDARLARIIEKYECSPEAVQGDGTGADLVRAIRQISQIRGRLSEIEAEIEQIIRSDIYQLRVRLEEAAKEGRDLLNEMSDRVTRQVAALRNQLQQHGRATKV